MATLRYPASGSGIVGQHVSLDHGDGPEEISQHPRGKQPAHARPDNNRVLTRSSVGRLPVGVANLRHRLAFASALTMSASKPAAAALARWRSMKFR